MMVRKALLICGLVMAVPACSTIRAGARPTGEAIGGTVITAQDIERTGARDAMEVLERSRHHLTIKNPGNGRDPMITSRGVGSILLDPRLIVVVDGSRVADAVGTLRSIPAPSILWIQILTGSEATTVYGTSAGNGAILVATGAGGSG